VGFLPGSWFGEGTVLKREPCRYFADALRDSRLAMLPSESFQILLEQSLGFNRFILNQLNERLSTFIAAREWERLKEPHLRVARQLAQLCGSISPARGQITLKVRQHELAELAGLSRQCVNGALAELGRRGTVRVQYGSIVILDQPALERDSD
jgi:CRP/FNR family transcriptional regulator, cyclic AMP receptor protein